MELKNYFLECPFQFLLNFSTSPNQKEIPLKSGKFFPKKWNVFSLKKGGEKGGIDKINL